MNARQVALLTLISGIFLLDWVAPGQQPRRVDDAALRNAGKSGEEWLSYGLTPGETRYSPLRSDRRDQRQPLGAGLVLRYRSGRRQPGSHSLMSNGTLYSITNWSIVYAVDARTGKEKVALGSGSEPGRPCSPRSAAAS